MTFAAAGERARTSPGGIMRGAEIGSDWNFEGCAVAGKLASTCLPARNSNKDYWLDWLNHHPETLMYCSESSLILTIQSETLDLEGQSKG